MKKENANSWLKVLEKEIGGRPESVPEGWASMDQIQKELGLTIGQAEGFISRAIKLGKVTKKKYRIQTRVGIKDVWHYNMKK